MDINIFNTYNLYDATKRLFGQLNINLNSNTAQALNTKDILGDLYKDRAPFDSISKTYFAGLISDEIFGENSEKLTYEQAERKSYNSLMIFAVQLDKTPNRTEISEITRAFNKKSLNKPVAVLFYYDNKISLSLPERFLYNQTWRQGEKVGKVIILRDISTTNTHAGHKRILQELANHNAKNFNELHEAWLKVLDVQVLNKSFYTKLVEWYEKCLADIDIDLAAASRELGKNIDNELRPQVVIRIIIRMMFMWFMKEKGLIDDKFFTKEFTNDFLKNENTYYNAILQNLFFAVLNKKIDERRFRKQDKTNYYNPEKNDYGIFDVFRYKSMFNKGKAEEFLEQTKQIPFVNGGLFQCHDYKFKGKDENGNRNIAKNYLIDGFSEKTPAKVSDGVIFELIKLFNDFVFTIEESTPMEADIALDPELLGTVFENLIGSYNPETKETARKQTGSFYTPREIVDYMCKESLKESLKTKFSTLGKEIDSLIEDNEDKLDFPQKNNIIAAITNLKILDPACGSGAFPMGMFNLMVRTIEKLQEHKTTYKNKLDIITNCIYGVDIQNIAVEISKLRFFISLLVDAPNKKTEDFDVLPNLETKFVVANSLIGIETKKTDDSIEFFDLENAFKELTKIFLHFTTAKSPKEKEQIKNEFSKKKQEIVENPNFNFNIDVKKKILDWNPFNVCYCSPFFDSGIMFGIADGFDIVIGNPPYVSTRNMDNSIKEKLKSYTLAQGQYDLFILFIEKANQLLNQNGVFSFIIPKKLLTNENFKSARQFILKNLPIRKYLDAQMPFESAAVEANVIISTRIKTDFVKTFLYENGSINFSFDVNNELIDLMPFNIFPFAINPNNVSVLYSILHKTKDRLSNFVYIIRGMECGFNHNCITKNKGKYKVIKGEHIEKWKIKSTEWFVFPELCEKKVMKTELVYQTIPKLLTKFVSNSLDFTLDEIGYYNTNVVYNVLLKEKSPLRLLFILGLCNSKLINFCFFNTYVNDDKLFPHIQKNQLDSIPIPATSLENQQPIIILVEQILQSKKENADTSELEKKIDILVYKLYGLTEEEIKIVEGGQ
ncbi:hypothetical protein AGMMS49938_06860 [Fibrobacterales bacterium]|nr:hypothetical protein AGMMS49938_06860 [Fibrobacterales bacterium]